MDTPRKISAGCGSSRLASLLPMVSPPSLLLTLRHRHRQRHGHQVAQALDEQGPRHFLLILRILAVGLSSPGGLIIVFFSSNHCPRHNHHFSEKLWQKYDVFDENLVCACPNHRPEAARISSPGEC